MIYIPFWIYSNFKLLTADITSALFTFHSGYIPISQGFDRQGFDAKFTFHSGYIPIEIKALKL